MAGGARHEPVDLCEPDAGNPAAGVDFLAWRGLAIGVDVRHQRISDVGDGGRQPEWFFAVHSIATDSKGNILTKETYERRRLAEPIGSPFADLIQAYIGAVPLDA